MGRFHKLGVYFGLTDPDPEEQAVELVAEPTSWWRVLIGLIVMVLVATGLVWLVGDSSLGRSFLAGLVAGMAVSVITTFRERRRQRS